MIWLLTRILVNEVVNMFVHGNVVVVEGGLMFLISTVGLFVNVFMICILGHHHGHDHEVEESHIHGLSVHHHDGEDNQKPLLEYKSKRGNINVQGGVSSCSWGFGSKHWSND